MTVSIFVHVKQGSLLSALTITVRIFMKSLLKCKFLFFMFFRFLYWYRLLFIYKLFIIHNLFVGCKQLFRALFVNIEYTIMLKLIADQVLMLKPLFLHCISKLKCVISNVFNMDDGNFDRIKGWHNFFMFVGINLSICLLDTSLNDWLFRMRNVLRNSQCWVHLKKKWYKVCFFRLSNYMFLQLIFIPIEIIRLLNLRRVSQWLSLVSH